MGNKIDFFEIFENYEPDEKILSDKTSKEDKERIKFLVFKKKGESKMMIKKYSVAAAFAVMVILSGTIGVDAASNGAVRKAVKTGGEALISNVSSVLHIKTTDKNGTVNEKDVNVDVDENGNMTYTVPSLNKGENVEITDENGSKTEVHSNVDDLEFDATVSETKDSDEKESGITIKIKKD